MEQLWNNEPDFEEFDYQDIKCKVIRNEEMLSLCGYAGVNKQHPLYGLSDYEVQELLDCHGGVTFVGTFPDDERWYFGFDCSHSSDLVPRMVEIFSTNPQLSKTLNQGIYRNFSYVKDELLNLAKQLHTNKIRYLFRDRT